jgi:ABC-type sugar transport system ATPase subunit
MLSGGQRQAIAIARSVHSGARILLLDEPLAAMGAKEGEMILDLIRDLKEKGHSMIVVAHNYVHVLEVCDRVNLLQHGRITLDRLSSETTAEELTELVAREYRRQRNGRTASADESQGRSARLLEPPSAPTKAPKRPEKEGREEGPL